MINDLDVMRHSSGYCIYFSAEKVCTSAAFSIQIFRMTMCVRHRFQSLFNNEHIVHGSIEKQTNSVSMATYWSISDIGTARCVLLGIGEL